MSQRARKSSSTKTPDSNAKSRRADDELRQKLPPGVKLLRTLRGHTKFIGRVAWSSDGRTLASTSADRTIRIWDAEKGKLLRVLDKHHNYLNGLAFHPASTTLATLGREVKLWDQRSGTLLKRFGDEETPQT